MLAVDELNKNEIFTPINDLFQLPDEKNDSMVIPLLTNLSKFGESAYDACDKIINDQNTFNFFGILPDKLTDNYEYQPYIEDKMPLNLCLYENN